MSRKSKENRHYVKQATYSKRNGNQGNLNPYLGKHPAVPRTRRESYRKTVYPSHEKRTRRNG